MKLKTIDLTKEYTRAKQGFEAVQQANIYLDSKELVSIIGHSGCGKSTLLNMITGMIAPTSGQILLDDTDITNYSRDAWAVLRSGRIGYMPQGQSLLGNFTILDNICMPAYLTGSKKDVTDKGLSLLEKVGLKGAENEYPANLSGGEVRRVAIVRSLINEPELLIADEPTSSLDPESAKIIMELFKTISSEGVSVLVSTHDYEFLNYSNRTYKMEHGIIIAD